MNELVHITISHNDAKISETYLARIGVSDTLYADRAGNVFCKRQTRTQPSPFAIIDDSGAAYDPSEYLDTDAPVSQFYERNRPLIERAAARALAAHPFET